MTYTVKRLDEFSEWLKGLKDELTRQRLNKRLRIAQLGNLGDVESVGEGVFEMREHFGPGWRMYYVQRGEVLNVILEAATNPRNRPTFAELQHWRNVWRIDHDKENQDF